MIPVSSVRYGDFKFPRVGSVLSVGREAELRYRNLNLERKGWIVSLATAPKVHFNMKRPNTQLEIMLLAPLTPAEAEDYPLQKPDKILGNFRHFSVRFWVNSG